MELRTVLAAKEHLHKIFKLMVLILSLTVVYSQVMGNLFTVMGIKAVLNCTEL